MPKSGVLLAVLPLLVGSPAAAATIIDPTGDFLPSYVFDHDPDLDVTSFSVDFNDATDTFLLGASLAGAVDLSQAGFYGRGSGPG